VGRFDAPVLGGERRQPDDVCRSSIVFLAGRRSVSFSSKGGAPELGKAESSPTGAASIGGAQRPPPGDIGPHSVRQRRSATMVRLREARMRRSLAAGRPGAPGAGPTSAGFRGPECSPDVIRFWVRINSAGKPIERVRAGGPSSRRGGRSRHIVSVLNPAVIVVGGNIVGGPKSISMSGVSRNLVYQRRSLPSCHEESCGIAGGTKLIRGDRTASRGAAPACVGSRKMGAQNTVEQTIGNDSPPPGKAEGAITDVRRPFYWEHAKSPWGACKFLKR